MSGKVVVQSVGPDQWERLFHCFADANYRQLAAYSAAAALRLGATSENVVIRKGEQLIGIANVRIKRLPLLPLGIAYVNGAPLVERSATDDEGSSVVSVGDRREQLALCLAALRGEFEQRRGLLLRVVGTARCGLHDVERDEPFARSGFSAVCAKGAYRTLMIDLRRDLAEIRSAFDQKWRNVLNKSERQGLRIVRGDHSGLFVEYSELHRHLVARKNLLVDLGPDFFMAVQESLKFDDRFVVHLAVTSDGVVAGHIGAFHGDTAVYLLGAADDEGLRCGASYLLQWHVMAYAKERGCRWYDLGGIDRQANPDVYRFKARMGGVEVRAPGPYESGTPASRMAIRVLEAVYRKVRK